MADRVRMSPKARRLAHEHGLDPAQLSGSGADGVVLAGDVALAAEAARAEESRLAAERAAAEDAARLAAERAAREESARIDAERRAREEAARRAQEEAARRTQDEAARRAREDAARAVAVKEAAEQAAQEEAARIAAARRAAEEMVRAEAARAAADAERTAREQAVRTAASAERDMVAHALRESADRAERAATIAAEQADRAGAVRAEVHRAAAAASDAMGRVEAARAEAAAAEASARASAGAAEAAASVADAARAFIEAATRTGATIPQIVLTRTIDASALRVACDRLAPRIEASHRVRLSHTDLIVAAAARALRQHPRMNASWINGALATNHHVHVALALPNDSGVVPAVIRNTDRAALGDVARRRRDLTDALRTHRLLAEDMVGATFTISDLGMFNVDACTATVIPPQAGILAVGSIADRVIAVDGLIGVRPTLTITLSADHRIVDGARAAAFLNDVAVALSEPQKWT
jgi:pyruvate dehydrogenase E2 component (dihydrolipoamide acetyltransferase)